MREAVMRDIEDAAEATWKTRAMEKEKANQEKGKEKPHWRGQRKGAAGREAHPASDRGAGRAGESMGEGRLGGTDQEVGRPKEGGPPPAPCAANDRKNEGANSHSLP